MTKTDRQVKLDEATERLTQAVESIVTGEDWQRYLAFASELHTYSARNVFMLLEQAEDRGWDSLGHVAGFKTWQGLGRQVRQGEKSLKILAPCRYKVTEDDGTEHYAVRGFTVASVFAARQTDGDGVVPEPVRPELLTGDGPTGAWDTLTELVAEQGFSIERGPLEPANGTTDMVTRTVTVADRLDGAAAVKTLAHELAHVLMHNGPICDYLANRGRCEVEAESVAYLVCDAFGLASDGYSFAYVANWSRGEMDVVLAAADKVRKCAATILESLSDAKQVKVAA
jgi:antirestriction protein ArdC